MKRTFVLILACLLLCLLPTACSPQPQGDIRVRRLRPSTTTESQSNRTAHPEKSPAAPSSESQAAMPADRQAVPSSFTSPQADESYYQAVLDRYLDLLFPSDREPETDILEAEEALRGAGMLHRDLVGYCFYDLDHDRQNELLILSCEELEPEPPRSSLILAAYGRQGDKPALLFSSSWHQSYHLLANDLLLCQTFRDEGQQFLALYQLKQQRLATQDFYFTVLSEKDHAAPKVYHNQTGQTQVESSEDTGLHEEGLLLLIEAYLAEDNAQDMTVFHRDSSSQSRWGQSPQAAKIQISNASAVLATGQAYDFLIVDQSESQQQIVLRTDQAVYDFEVLALELADVDEINFTCQTIYRSQALRPERPLMIALTFFGTIPHYGIAYTDADGSRHRLVIDQSGLDGSLLLWEF